MGRRHYQASGGGDVVALVEEIEQTGDRLAAAVEALAYKKAHLKGELIEIAEEKADQFLEKAEETKDRLVAKISDKIPDRRELKQMASKAVAKIGDSAAVEKAVEAKDTVVEKAVEAKDTVVEKAVEAKDTVVEKAAAAEHRIAAVAAERLPEAKQAASDVAEKVVDTVSRAGETAVTRLRHRRIAL
jgi:Late embryogenesis abundant protein